ncbi:LTA synthase family protein [Thalassomonas viridans]|uniref:LTA synthase family protein n=1 Tax=Thalassomonas viridans TaxID=137584 RepID=A0AAE9Z3W8_9GAMM|nr:LTA synthase family protein [Thalassomonas viridans]WDE06160.1 LTA synthase family protein [Thalassomonas viridans]
MPVYKVYRPFIAYILLLLSVLTFSRTLLLLWQRDRLESMDSVITILFNGLRIDISSVAYLLILPALLHGLFAFSRRLYPCWLKVLRCYFFLPVMLLVFLELATPEFIIQYGVRPNRLFIEYLEFPQEVFGMLFEGHLAAVLFAVLGLALALVCYSRLQGKIFTCAGEQVMAGKPVLAAGVILVSFVGVLSARGTLGHRPLNPSLVYFSTDPLINSLTLNSSYSVLFALKQLGNEKNAAAMYGKLPEHKVLDIVKSESQIPALSFINPQIPTLAQRMPYLRHKRKNVVIVLEESLGAKHVGALGGKDLTPNLDKYINSGWAFDHLYATGTRSVRGIEAVITGFTPTPARSVVKLDKSQQGFFTIADVLQKQGYVTQFIYGGESHFDNMKSFFLGNGFTDIVDLPRIENPGFVGSWGASDGDLFRQAVKELNRLHGGEQPFFSLIFTSSNHTPFEIPAGKTPQRPGEDGREKAIRYADFALGEFIETSKQQAYWQDTIFLIVADHDSRTKGQALVPLSAFHIPGVLLNSGMENKRDSRLVSQIDLPVTLLSLAGIASPTPMLGRDLTREYSPERAMMQYNENFAYVENDRVAILQPGKAVSYWHWDKLSKSMTRSAELPLLGEKALAHALFGSLAYKKRLFRSE